MRLKNTKMWEVGRWRWGGCEEQGRVGKGRDSVSGKVAEERVYVDE